MIGRARREEARWGQRRFGTRPEVGRRQSGRRRSDLRSAMLSTMLMAVFYVYCNLTVQYHTGTHRRVLIRRCCCAACSATACRHVVQLAQAAQATETLARTSETSIASRQVTLQFLLAPTCTRDASQALPLSASSRPSVDTLPLVVPSTLLSLPTHPPITSKRQPHTPPI